MNLTAHELYVAMENEDGPYASLWLRDTELDFVFSLGRSLDEHDEDATRVSVMVLDQAWCYVEDLSCSVTSTMIHVEIPEALRSHTSDQPSLSINMSPHPTWLREGVAVLEAIFRGKAGLSVAR